MTDTLTNEAPMLTEDLAFDLGEVIKCDGARISMPCGNEPTWMYLQHCSCGGDGDRSFCDPCRKYIQDYIASLYPYTSTCLVCNKAASIEWRPI